MLTGCRLNLVLAGLLNRDGVALSPHSMSHPQIGIAAMNEVMSSVSI